MCLFLLFKSRRAGGDNKYHSEMNQLRHMAYFAILVLGFFFFYRRGYDANIPGEYELAFYLNIVLFSVSCLIDALMQDTIGKRLLVWLLYYEITTPIFVLFCFSLNNNIPVHYAVRFFIFYLFYPGAYFTILTCNCFFDFLRDTHEGHQLQSAKNTCFRELH